MSFVSVLLHVAVLTMVLASLYICFSRDFFRMTVALFLETCSLGLILLSKNYDFLAAFLILAGVLAIVVGASFTKVINGELKRLRESSSGVYAKIMASVIGIGVSAVLIRELLSIYEIRQSSQSLTKEISPDVFQLGEEMVGRHSVAFLCFISVVLIFSLGLTHLLKDQNKNRGTGNG